MPTKPALFTRATALSALVGAAALVAAQPAAAASPCPKSPKNVVAKATIKADGYAYVVGKSLFGCGRVNGDNPLRVYKLGPWTSASQALYSEGALMWTERRRTSAGTAEDRIWVSGLSTRPLLRGIAAVRKPSDRVVAKLLPGGAWVTEGGAVAIARDFFDDPDLIGVGSPGAAPVGSAPGLAAAAKPSGARLELGRWGADAVPTLIATYKFEGSDVDADGCSAVSAYEATVVPVAGQQPVGVSWQETTRFDVEGCM